jgi:hypothetical protein
MYQENIRNRFGQTKPCSLVLGLSQLLKLPQPPQKMMLYFKVLKVDLKIYFDNQNP